MKKGRRGGSEGDISVDELPGKKRGHPLLLGEELDKLVQEYLTSFRENGAVVNTAIAMACASTLYASHLSLTVLFLKSLCSVELQQQRHALLPFFQSGPSVEECTWRTWPSRFAKKYQIYEEL